MPWVISQCATAVHGMITNTHHGCPALGAHPKVVVDFDFPGGWLQSIWEDYEDTRATCTFDLWIMTSTPYLHVNTFQLHILQIQFLFKLVILGDSSVSEYPRSVLIDPRGTRGSRIHPQFTFSSFCALG